MLKSFLILELPLDASDNDIRKRYLELVKQFTPEKFPEQFHKITAAYDAVKDCRSRVKSKLLAALHDVEIDKTIIELAGYARFKKKKAGLKELINAIGK